MATGSALWSQRRLPEPLQHRGEDFQHRAALAELRQRAVVGQLLLHPQFRAQRLAGFQNLDHAPIGRFQISPQHQAGHELPLRKILAAGHRAIVAQVLASQLHRQSRHAQQPIAFLLNPL